MAMKTSCLLKKLKLTPSSIHMRWAAAIPKVLLKDNVEKLIAEEKVKPRKQPGIIRRGTITLPDWIIEAMRISLGEVERPQLYEERLKFANYLFSRRLPTSDRDLKSKYYDIEMNMLEGKLKDLTPAEIEEIRKDIKGKVSSKLKQKVFGWKPLEYNEFRSLLYMITRSAAEYSALYTIFNEIRTRDPEFDPRTMFDFGSGVGSSLWAATTHWKRINEYLGVDISDSMNNLSQAIIDRAPFKIKGLFYRQYMPVSNLKHDLIVSAYSLMELPDSKNRLDVIARLWKKTNKYLVIVEQGTNAGFTLVNEARDFVKHIMKSAKQESDYSTFSPCPHELACPRYEEARTPCNFIITYNSLPMLGAIRPTKELYSYVVLKKDQRAEDDNWYRLVRPTILGSRHARCRMCTKDGQLQEIVFTAAKHGKPLYRCAKASQWGDRLPVKPNPELEASIMEELSSETAESEHEQEKPDYCSRAPSSTLKDDL